MRKHEKIRKTKMIINNKKRMGEMRDGTYSETWT